MKKTLALLVALCMLGTFVAACGDEAGPSGGGGDSIKVDVFWYTFADTYLASVRNAMESQFNGVSNISYTMHDCQENQAQQTEMVRTAITQGTDLLVVNIVTTGSEEAAMNILDQAREADLPIIFFNREVSDSVINAYDKAVFVGTDADEAGYMQGEAIANFLLEGDNISYYDVNGDGQVSYIMLRGEHGNAEAFGRTKYSVEEANRQLAGAGITLVPSPANETSTQYDDDGVSNYFLMADWSAAIAADLMRTAMTAHSLTDGSIELIIANNDDAALGAIEALMEVGYNTGSGPYIPVFGVDATDVAQQAISANRMTATILQDAVGMADCIVLLAGNIANGNDLMSSTGRYTNIDAGVAKIRIPYAIFSGGSVPPPTPPEGGGEIKVDVFWYTFADTYLASVRNAMEAQLGGHGNINYTMHDCQENQAQQTEMVRTAITQGTDLLIVNIVTTGSEEAAMNILDQARDANIPIIFFNREVSDSVINAYDKAVFVGTDADEAGYMQGEAIANFLLSGDNIATYDVNGDNEIAYIMLRGEHGNAEAFGRTKYSVEEANRQLAGAGITLVPSPANETSTQYDNDGVSNYFLMADWSAAIAADLMRTAMTAHSLTDGSIELIIANNDDAALGAIEALMEVGYNTGSGNYVPVFGVDATDVAQQAISAGRMTATILQDAVGMADCIVILANNIASGVNLLDYTGSYTNIDSGVAKIRIPYAIFS